ncbi:M1 family metallopeptidase [Mucilaginibacter sp. BJC16-A38]|uniref:M1 family metallopeptidase n=1 Tax=Mucilaginibacter phenanthrenivorans TaxID=1234842 RepID=UPI0021574B3D|nr:M1 family metallopeptidase [Mucilaginibacter phenanthrenivorans]MCR8557610.1 M1 family metallopeptidase [Mucilaginibacter phenanthrenivorans]
MLRSTSLAAVFCLALLQMNAQTLTHPPEVQQAFDKGTRAENGKPGKNYWQNHGRYNISVSMTPPNKTITGVEDITYFNSSPDVLSSLNMKLIVNVHRGRTPTAANAPQGITVDEITINGAKADWDNEKAVTTNYMLDLKSPLKSHDSLKMNIKWHYQLSTGRGRDGAIDSTSFFLAYFYPRVSVYDDYKGWDTQPHTGGLEFYNDFNDYQLSVTVPKNYIVWATGTLQNPNEVLQPEAAKRLQTSMTSDSTIHIATAQDLAAKSITSQNATNTWKWNSSHITDVTVGVSDHYDWDAASVIVDDKAHRRTSVQAAFPDSSADFHQYVKFAHNSLDWFSHNLPGVPYPFPKTTSFQGYADMEYPMMVNDSHEKDLTFAQLVQDHEIAHTYFPFYMGTNESRYAFMDEGWATTFELLIGTAEKGKKVADDFYKNFRVNRWTHGPHEKEMPIITPSPDVTFGSGNNAYGKPSLSYLALKDLLGDVLFKKALHTYMDNWNGKHPIPWDYFNSMKAGSGKNLDWFFYNWFYTPYYIDLSLEKAEKAGDGYALSIKNIGGFAVPFDAVVTYADGTTDSFHQTPIVWEKDQKAITIKIKPTKDVKSITIDGGIFVDADMKNNTWTAN